MLVFAAAAALVAGPAAASPASGEPAASGTSAEAGAKQSAAGAEERASAVRRRQRLPKPARLRIKPAGLNGGKAPIMGAVRIHGSLAPYVPGQRVEVLFYRNGKPVKRKAVKVHRAGRRNYGRFRAVVKSTRPGKWAAAARHRANRRQSGAHTKRKSWKLRYPSISSGQCGPVAVGFKRSLRRMGYITNGGKCLGSRTGRGILAYRRVNGMAQNRKASSKVVRDAYLGRGGFNVRHPGAPGVHMEVPLSKQVLVFAKKDRPVAIYPISSGKPSTPTVTGSWQMDWTQPGYNDLDMYYSWYFYRGYAIHGYKSVPNHPASNGCIRTFESDQPEIFNRISKGDWIYIW